MVVTWVTQNKTNHSMVEYGTSIAMNLQSSGSATKFVDGGNEHRALYIHRVTIVAKPGESYCKSLCIPNDSILKY